MIKPVDKEGRTFLHYLFAKEPDYRLDEILTIMRRWGINIPINKQDKHGNTPLHCFPWGCERVNAYVLKGILDYPGVNLQMLNKEGLTPLGCAVNALSLRWVNAFYEYDANL